jgi:hypothetical protein
MKNILMISFLLVFIKPCCGQTDSCKFDKNYFLIGTLSDYMGRETYIEKEFRVDVYDEMEKALAFTIDSIFKVDYPDVKLTVDKKTGKFEIYSKTLVKFINNFYTYEPSGRTVYNGNADFEKLNLDSLSKTTDFFTSNFDTIYTGSLRSDNFKTEIQKLSFITGMYVRFAVPNDTLSTIRIYNSPSRAKIFVDLLKEMQCTNVEYKVIKGIPVSHSVFFTPTIELQAYLSKYATLRQVFK